jgi:hypothetical protein|tara:strand:- start:525 stop:830 length:306 start_codon:yes stop_codon:yes gene_type:complete
VSILRKINIAIGVLIAASIPVVWLWVKPMMDVGTGYAAKQICSCIYLGARTFEDCHLDILSDSGAIDVRWAEEHDGVEASILLISDTAAYYHPGTGCTIER